MDFLFIAAFSLFVGFVCAALYLYVNHKKINLIILVEDAFHVIAIIASPLFVYLTFFVGGTFPDLLRPLAIIAFVVIIWFVLDWGNSMND